MHDNKFFVELYDFNNFLYGLGVSRFICGELYARILTNIFGRKYRYKIYVRGKCIDINIQKQIYYQNINNLTHNIICSSVNYKLFQLNNLVKVNFTELNIDFSTQFIIFYIKKLFESPYKPPLIESIGLNPNKQGFVYWNNDELMEININEIKVYILCFDPQFKDINKFRNYLDNKINHKNCSGINFSRIDNMDIQIKLKEEYNNSYLFNYDVIIMPFNINILYHKIKYYNSSIGYTYPAFMS